MRCEEIPGGYRTRLDYDDAARILAREIARRNGHDTSDLTLRSFAIEPAETPFGVPPQPPFFVVELNAPSAQPDPVAVGSDI